jgi:hypothetical protein
LRRRLHERSVQTVFSTDRPPDGLCANVVSATAAGGWTICRWGWQFTASEGLDEAYVPFFGACGTAWDDGMVARWSANPLGMLWPEMDAALRGGDDGGGGPAGHAAPAGGLPAGS